MHIHGNPYINCIHYMAVMTHWEHGDRSHIPNTAPLAHSWHQTREFHKPWAVSTLWYHNTLHRAVYNNVLVLCTISMHGHKTISRGIVKRKVKEGAAR
jgi:hypothetical protein